MMKKLTVIVICLSAVLAVAQQMPRRGAMMGPRPAAADGPMPPAALKDALGLSDDQVARLMALQRERADAHAAVMQATREKQKLLDETLKAGGASAATVGQLLLDITAARQSVQEDDKKYHALALAVLTADQTTKLAALEAALKMQLAAQQAIGLNLIQGIPGPPPGPGRMPGPPPAPPE